MLRPNMSPGPRGCPARPAPSLSGAIVPVLAFAAFTGGCADPRGGRSKPGELYEAGAVFADVSPVISRTFRVTNTTGQRVRILGETHSCTCTSIELQKAVLEPGQSIPLEMTVRVDPDYAKLDIVCVVKTDHPKFPEWMYGIRYTSYPRGRIVPGPIDLGLYGVDRRGQMAPAPGNDGKAFWLELFAPGGDVLPEPAIAPSPDGIAAEIGPPTPIESLEGGASRRRYPLTIRPTVVDGAAGAHSRDLTIRSGDRILASSQVHWDFRGPYVCTPSQVHFGMVDGGDARKSARVIVRASDGEAFRVLSFESGSPSVAILLDGEDPGAAPQHVFELTLSIPTDSRTQALSGVARIRTDREGSPEIRMPWSAFVRPAGWGRGGEASPSQ